MLRIYFVMSRIIIVFFFLFLSENIILFSVENSEKAEFTNSDKNMLNLDTDKMISSQNDNIQRNSLKIDDKILDSANNRILNERSKSMLYKRRALEISNNLLKNNFSHINTLDIAISNYGSDDLKDRLLKVYEVYKHGTKLYYTKKMLFAEQKLVENKNAIFLLYQDVLKLYSSNVENLLDIGVDRLISVKLFLAKNASTASITELSVLEAQGILESAYYYLDLAKEQEKVMLYEKSLVYYRLANLYSINLLIHLVPNQEAKEKLRNKYSKELLDINRISIETPILLSSQDDY